MDIDNQAILKVPPDGIAPCIRAGRALATPFLHGDA